MIRNLESLAIALSQIGKVGELNDTFRLTFVNTLAITYHIDARISDKSPLIF